MTKHSLETSKELKWILIRSENYRSFLGKAFELFGKEKGGFSYAAFARKAGLSSRSFPRDVIWGRRRLTPSSTMGFSKALGLSGDVKNYFELLVARDELDESALTLESRRIHSRLEKLKSRIERGFPSVTPLTPLAFKKFHPWFEIYASLGKMGEGATLDQIAGRTQFTPGNCETMLKEMIEQSICRLDSDTLHFHALSLHPVFQGLGANALFQDWFLHCLDQSKKNAKLSFDSDAALFSSSVVSVKKHRMPEFKSKLRDLLVRFVDEVEDGEGEMLARLTLSFF